MRNTKSTIPVQVRIYGEKNQIDGLMELIVGTLFIANMLRGKAEFRRDGENGTSYIYLEMDLVPPPLGNLGEADLPEYKGNNP